MEISDKVKFQIIYDIQEALDKQCKNYNMPPFNLDDSLLENPEELNKKFNELFDLNYKYKSNKGEGYVPQLNEYEIQKKIEKSKFMSGLRDEVFKKQYITLLDKDIKFVGAEIGDILKYLYSECSINGIDAIIEDRLDEVLTDFFGQMTINDQMLEIMIKNEEIAAKNIKQMADPSRPKEQRKNVWRTEIASMLNHILKDIQENLKEDTYDTSIINKIDKQLNKHSFFAPIMAKWKKWDSETSNRLSFTEEKRQKTPMNISKGYDSMKNRTLDGIDGIEQKIKEFKPLEKKIKNTLKDDLKKAKILIANAQAKLAEHNLTDENDSTDNMKHKR
jgi:hypothetical protein